MGPQLMAHSFKLPFGLELNTSIQVAKDAIDEQISNLHREATQLKGKDWPGAVALLQKAAELDERHSRWLDAARMVRLPVFMQQAGQFDAALLEFARLIRRVPAQVQATAGNTGPLFIRALGHHETALIYDKKRVACKREKSAALAEDSALRADTHRAAWEKLQPALDKEREMEAAAYRAKSLAREAARAAGMLSEL